MKFQFQTVAALALASGASAFCPAPIASRPTTDLPATTDRSDFDMGRAAMSFVAASVLAVSSSTTLLPMDAALAATPVATEKVQKVEKAPKVDLKKLAPEERNKIMAKQNLDLSEQTLKEYTKYAAEAKTADSKASAALKAQEKTLAAAKKAVISDSDKLSAAKNQKMPQTAIKELTTKAGK